MLDLDANFDLLTLDAVTIPAFKGTTIRRIRVCAIMGVKQAAADEWMFEMHEGSSKSQYSASNEAFGLFLEGRIDEAAELVRVQLSELTASAAAATKGLSMLCEMLQYTDNLVRRAQDTANPSEFGINFANPLHEYFVRCLLPTVW